MIKKRQKKNSVFADEYIFLGQRSSQHEMFSRQACSLVGLSQDLSAMIQCFPLTTNQHQPGLSVQKPTSEQAEYLNNFRNYLLTSTIYYLRYPLWYLI